MTIPHYATVHLCSVLATSAFGAMFGVLWLGRGRSLHLLLSAAASATYAAALIGLGLGLSRVHPLGGFAMFVLLGGSSGLVLAAVNAFEGKPVIDRTVLALPLVPALAFTVPAMLPDGTFGTDACTAGRIANSAALAAIFVVLAAVLLRGRNSRAPRSRRILALAHIGYVPGYLLSIAMEIGGALPIDALALVPMLSDQLLLGVLNIGLLAMPGERDAAALRTAALTDPLTGAGNRAALADLERNGIAAGTGVILLDVDRFKQINDAQGHAAGDALLVALARLAAAALPAGARLFRLGGDEFIAVLPPGGGAVRDSAERLLWEAQMRHDGPRCSLSIGVATVESGEPALAAAIERADVLLYRAKAAGRGRLAA